MVTFMDNSIIQNESPKPKSIWFRSKILTGIIIGLLFEIGGYVLMRGNQTAFGWVMFIGVPMMMGFAVALFTETKRQTFWSLCATWIIGIGFLILAKWEGYICCVLASPLLLGCGILGAVVGHKTRLRLLQKNIKTISKLLLLGIGMVLLAGAKAVEKPYLNARLEVFNTSVLVPVPPDKAWDLIKSIERVDTQKPLMLAIGLPVPQSCTLDKEAVGGKRTCYFDQGIIYQEITEWDPPHFMKTKITGSTLPGRHWLTFVDASYEFIPRDNQTLVVRTTTISSRLYPRWYWRQFEEYGVCSEHEYVLSDLVRRAKNQQERMP
jgi:hypothetical protein